MKDKLKNILREGASDGKCSLAQALGKGWVKDFRELIKTLSRWKESTRFWRWW